MDLDWPKVVASFLGTALILGILVYVVGVEDLAHSFALLDARSIALIAAVGLCWLAAWGFSLRTVLSTLEVPVSVADGFLLYASAAFANNVTPFGQAGGEPFSAYLISRATSSEYERSLAAIASVDSLNFVPSIALASFGLLYYAATFAVGDSIILVSGVVVGLAVLIPTLAYFAWLFRKRIQHGAAEAVGPILRAIGKHVPGVSAPKPRNIRARIAGFFKGIGRVADDRRGLAFALGFSALGWLFMCLALWLTLGALGHPVPVAIVFIVVPVGTIASIAPLPGGAGGVEFAIVLLLVPTTGVSAATASAAAIVYRGSTYWLPTLVGGLSVVTLESRTNR